MPNKKIAVLIDSENTSSSKLSLILNELSSFGQIIVKRAYGDFSLQQLKNWKKPLNELAIQAKQQFAYTVGKNSTDSLMIIDAMDLLYSNRFDAFALVSSDSDFTSLATRLRESEMHVIGVGKAKTPTSFKNACNDFIAIENLAEENDSETVGSSISELKDREIWRLMHQAYQKLMDDSGWAELNEVAKYIKRLKPDFDPRSYELKKLSDFFNRFEDRYRTRKIKGLGIEFKLILKSER